MYARLFAILVLSATILLSIAACALPGLPTSDPLKGTSWRLVLLGGTPLIPGTEITAAFEDGQVHGQACNSYGGSYTVSGDKLTVRELFMTEMACLDPEGIMQQEGQYLEMLAMASSFKISGQELRIVSSAGGELVFVQV